MRDPNLPASHAHHGHLSEDHHAHDETAHRLNEHGRPHAHEDHEAGRRQSEHSHPHVHDSGSDRGQALMRGVVALGIGLYLVYLQVSGEIGNYINVRFAWIALAGAVFAILLGVHALASTLLKQDPLGDHEHGDHVHQRPRWPALALLATPLLLAILVPARPLGAAAVGSGVSFSGSATGGDGATISTSDSMEWSVLDWLRAFSYSTSPERLNGKPADVTGFIFRNQGDPSGYLIVSRFLMVHCAADSYAIGLPVRWAAADSLPGDTWVRVRGNVHVGQFDGNSLPIIDAASVEIVAQPTQTYLYK